MNSLLTVMTLKRSVAIVLVLLFQWATVANALVPSGTCESGCDCCAAMTCCPCVVDDGQEPDDRLPPSGLPETVKLPAARLCEAGGLPGPVAVAVRPDAAPAATVERWSGYAGVGVPVSFCSLVM